jgi:topoisomerase-4 subunit A
MMITKVTDKKFVGKDLIYAHVWKKGDKRKIYHMIYQDGKGGQSMMKRFYVNSITRDTEYELTKGTKSSRVHYFSAHPNGEREVVSVVLRPRPHLKKSKFEVDFGELLIKGRKSVGNRVTRELIQKVVLKEIGGSTLAARKIWYDQTVNRLNDEERGQFVGDFKGDDKILSLYDNGEYRLSSFDLSTRFDEDLVHLEKWHPNRAISAVYFDGGKSIHYVKRFLCEVTSDKRVCFIGDAKGSSLSCFSTAYQPELTIIFNKQRKETKNLPDKVISVHDVIDVKGMKAQGNQLSKYKVKEVILNHAINSGAVAWPDEIKNDHPINPQPSQDSKTMEEVEPVETIKVKPEVQVENKKPDSSVKDPAKTDIKDQVPVVKAKADIEKKKLGVSEKKQGDKVSNKSTSKKKNEDNETSGSNTIEWDLTTKKSKDNPNDDDQMTLF